MHKYKEMKVWQKDITDISGQMIASAVANENSTRVDISGFAKGLYLINLKADNGTTLVRKLIVN